MNSAPLRIGAGILLMVAGVGAAYALGRWPIEQWSGMAGTTPANAAAPASRTVILHPAPITLEQAEEQLQALLADSSDLHGKWMAQLAMLVSQVKPADLPKLIAAIKDAPEGKAKTAALVALLEALGKTDPALAFSLLGDLNDPAARNQTAASVLGQWAARDPKGALAMLDNAPEWLDQNAVFRGIVSAMAQHAPTDLAALIKTLPEGTERDDAVKTLGTMWARSDPAAALDWALSLPPEYAATLGGVLQALAQKDPLLAHTYVDKIADDTVRQQVIAAIAADWATLGPKDPVAAMAWLSQVASGNTTSQALATILTRLSMPGSMQSLMSNGSVMMQATDGEDDIPGALAVFAQITDPSLRAGAIAALAKGWGMSDPQAALAWAQTLPDADAEARDAAMRNLLITWAKQDAMGAAQYAQNSPNPQVFDSIAQQLSGQLAKTDPQAALAWANALPDGTSQKRQAVNNALVGWATEDFDGAWSYAQNQPPGTLRNSALGRIVAGMASVDPAQAATLLDQVPPGNALATATNRVASTWAQQDPASLSAWINTQPAGAVKDMAITQLITVEAPKDPADVMAWANAISNPDTRATQVQTVLTAWAAKDPAAALQAAQTANLPDAQRAALVQTLSQAQGTTK